MWLSSQWFILHSNFFLFPLTKFLRIEIDFCWVLSIHVHCKEKWNLCIPYWFFTREVETSLISISVCPSVTLENVILFPYHRKTRAPISIKLLFLCSIHAWDSCKSSVNKMVTAQNLLLNGFRQYFVFFSQGHECTDSDKTLFYCLLCVLRNYRLFGDSNRSKSALQRFNMWFCSLIAKKQTHYFYKTFFYLFYYAPRPNWNFHQSFVN